MTSETTDRLAIRELIENWVLWRDSGFWDRFRTVWHDDGVMMATWFQGGPDAFIAVSKQGFERGVRIQHLLGGMTIDLKGKHAIAQTRMTIVQRGHIGKIECEVRCSGRFYDLLEKRKSKWGLVLRQPIYELDTIAPLDPAAKLRLDKKLLAKFPVGYRNLAYLQEKGGFKVKPDMPGVNGPAVEALYKKGAAWLAGKSI